MYGAEKSQQVYGNVLPADVEISSDNYVDVENVSRTFTKSQGRGVGRKCEELHVLENISFAVRKGEFLCIVGGSGCGKSTLLRAMAGLDPEHGGTVRIDGKDVTRPGRDRGLVFQEPRLFPWLTVEKNVIFALNEGTKEEKRQKAKACIHLVGLDAFSKSYPSELSGGMAQRANLARALVNEPSTLFLDEPFGALDAFTKIQLQNELLRIKRLRKTTMIMVTHDIEEAVYLADRILVMDRNPGRIRDIVEVGLPRPRSRNDYNFVQVRKKIYGYFFEEKEVHEEYNI